MGTSVNKAHTALAVAHVKANRNSPNNGKGKNKKGKDKKSACTNCKLKGHTKDSCFTKDKEKEHEAPEWWKRKQAAKAKEPKKETANAIAESSTKSENHTYIALGSKNFDSPIDKAPSTLVITSGHNHKAYSVSQLTDLIINCGASSYFSPDKSKFFNFHLIAPESIQAADRHIFSAIGIRELVVSLP